VQILQPEEFSHFLSRRISKTKKNTKTNKNQLVFSIPQQTSFRTLEIKLRTERSDGTAKRAPEKRAGGPRKNFSLEKYRYFFWHRGVWNLLLPIPPVPCAKIFQYKNQVKPDVRRFWHKGSLKEKYPVQTHKKNSSLSHIRSQVHHLLLLSQEWSNVIAPNNQPLSPAPSARPSRRRSHG
jgi:hypothetical protein